jgi:hypothetical protein
MAPVGAIEACRQWYHHLSGWIHDQDGGQEAKTAQYWLAYHFDDRTEHNNLINPMNILLSPTNEHFRLFQSICERERQVYRDWVSLLHPTQDPWDTLVALINRFYFSIDRTKTTSSPPTPRSSSPAISLKSEALVSSPNSDALRPLYKQENAVSEQEFCSPQYYLSAAEIAQLGLSMIPTSQKNLLEFLPSIAAKHTEEYASIDTLVKDTEHRQDTLRIMSVNISANSNISLQGNQVSTKTAEGEHWICYVELHQAENRIYGMIFNSSSKAYEQSCVDLLQIFKTEYQKKGMTFTCDSPKHYDLQEADAQCGVWVLLWLEQIVKEKEKTAKQIPDSIEEITQEYKFKIQDYRKHLSTRLPKENAQSLPPGPKPLTMHAVIQISQDNAQGKVD